jgi:hypothetical protein
MVTDVSDMVTASIFRVAHEPFLEYRENSYITFENRGSKLL